MPAFRQYILDRNTFLCLMQNEGDLLLAEPRTLHRRFPRLHKCQTYRSFLTFSGPVSREQVTVGEDDLILLLDNRMPRASIWERQKSRVQFPINPDWCILRGE